ncbi:MAG: hypothetical protein V3T88_03485 [Nitrosomonadaceae bacterium]
MAKRTILKLVQELGASIGSDEIDTLNETIEATEIATILEQTVDEIISRKRWEFLKDRVRQLDARTGGSLQLNTLNIPSDVTRVNCVKYRSDNDVETYHLLTYKQPCDFLELVQARDPADADTIKQVNEDGVSLFIMTNIAPQFYTSFDEEIITFDAYDDTRGTGNLIADSVIIADIVPVTDYTDPAAVLNIPERMESLVFNEALSTCNYRLRQTRDPKADRVALRQHRALREQEHVTNRDFKERSYGRSTSSGR